MRPTKVSNDLRSAIAARTVFSMLVGIAILSNPTSSFAQEYQGSNSGSRGTGTVSRLNPRSPLSFIRRSIPANEPVGVTASARVTPCVGVAPCVAREVPIPLREEQITRGADSWANNVASGSAGQISTYPASAPNPSTSRVDFGGGKSTKFDRHYLNFPHANVNQVKAYPASIPITGQSLSSMAGFDQELCAFMRQWQIPGASVSIVKNGKLLYSRAYGYADFEAKKPVQLDSVFRIGSISKTLTSVATLKLVEAGKLNLKQSAIPLLNYQRGSNSVSRSYDTRLKQITIQNLLQGTAGWDRSHNGDPMFMPLALQAAHKYSNTLRPTPEALIRYQLDKPLDFEPGTRFSYSNLGYSILGEIISKTTSMRYADYVKQEILEPLGIKSLQPGTTRPLSNKEVCYYGYPGESKGPSILPNIQANLPLEYGGDFYLEAMTADCGWVGTTADVAKFVSAVFGGTSRHPLHPATVRMMTEAPPLANVKYDTYFAMGWEVDPASLNKGMCIKKEGCLPGSTSLVLHKTDGFTCAIAFNSRPQMANVFQDQTQKMVEKALLSCKTF